MICLSCTGSTNNTNLDTIIRNRDFIDIIEIRADFLESEELAGLGDFPVKAGLPCILTYRKPEDGGNNRGALTSGGKIDVDGRCQIFADAIAGGGWKYVDLEDDALSRSEIELVRAVEYEGGRVIKSFHDFNGVPDGIAERMLANSYGDRFIPKAAVMPIDSEGLIKILEAHLRLAEIKKSSNGFSCINGPFLTDYILVGMGAIGVPSRIMAGAWGSMLTYASDGDIKAAPGHLSPAELALNYNYKDLRPETSVFGIIGNPVMHSKSPAIHNAAFKAEDLDAVYLPFETTKPEVLIENAAELNLYGLSVTVPHKQAVIKSAYWLDDSVSAIGACNTLVRRTAPAGSEQGSAALTSREPASSKADGLWHGYNTDWLGFLAPIDRLLDEGRIKTPLDGGRALVIGAGGAARAVVYSLVRRGMDVTIVNRTVEKAVKLAEQFGCRGAGLDQAGSGYSIVVQTTSAGMAPDFEGNPLPDFDFTGVELAYDIIYVPEKTMFLKKAEQAGCAIMNGIGMLEAQAAEQFRLFTGRVMQ